jgi:hypothetical protein
MTRSFVKATGQSLDVPIVLGGDGTIRTATEACAEKGSYLIPLPGGTMNMLSRGLYGDVAWEEALKNTLTLPRVCDGRQSFVSFREKGELRPLQTGLTSNWRAIRRPIL